MADQLGGRFDPEQWVQEPWESPMPSWICPHCGAISFGPMDVAYHYCGACHHFCDDER